MPWLLSVRVSTAPGRVSKKLGQPVPLSNLVEASNSSAPQPAHWNSPGRFSVFSGLEPGRSVPCSTRTLCCSGVSGRRVLVSFMAFPSPPQYVSDGQKLRPFSSRQSRVCGDHHLQHAAETAGISKGKSGIVSHIIHLPALRRVH